jgi:steroid delta-isomerase-like uncharacterized protein
MTNTTVLLATVLAGTLYACGDFTSVHTTSVERTLELQHSEVWSKGNFDSISSIYTEDYVGHFPGGQTVNGRDGLRKAVQSHRASFPNWDEQVLEIIVEGNHAATRYRSRGTHDGEFLGIPATGNEIDVLEASIYRMVDGKIAEQWAFPDIASVQQQLVPQQSD